MYKELHTRLPRLSLDVQGIHGKEYLNVVMSSHPGALHALLGCRLYPHDTETVPDVQHVLVCECTRSLIRFLGPTPALTVAECDEMTLLCEPARCSIQASRNVSLVLQADAQPHPWQRLAPLI